MLKVRLLGKFEVNKDGTLITIASRPAQSLFAFLILSAGTAHRREKLAGLLWPDSLEETARDNLRHALWRVRKALPSKPTAEYVLTDDLSIAFNASAEYWLDAAELEKVSENATADELISVLSLYQGELLPGFYDEWVALEREHLSSIFEHKMEQLLSLLQDEKRWLDILEWGERWISMGQKPEPAYCALMSAHAAKGDMSKVAATYERCVKSLKEFGVEPSEQTRALYERLKAGKENLETGPTVPVPLVEKREGPPKTNLPIPLTSFIGREREVEEVEHLLSSTRLLTLTGSGGIGKTRLAIQAANRLIKSYKDGVWWVELAPLIDGALVPQVVALVLRVPESPGQPLTESLKSFLREKQLLLILDNCEHIIAACAQLADDLLTQCADLRILTTSREALGITGETTLHVPALSFPVLSNLSQIQNLKEFESIQLFAERAAAARPDLALTQQNAFTVTQICHRLDGIPLALELAAAQVRVLSLEEIAARLDDRFALLTQGSRTALPRHQTLHALIDWSHDLLTEPEQILFRRLAIFAGGFTPEAAETVGATYAIKKSQVIDLLGQLIKKSLVSVAVREESAHASTRYGMLETIREHAREKLDEAGEMEQVRQCHRDFFIAFAEQAEQKLKGAEQFEWLDRLEVEHDNLRAAWDCAIDSDAESALRLASALRNFWFMRGNPSEGRAWLAKLLENTRQWGQTARRAHVLNVAGWLAYYQQDLAVARLLLEEALRIARRWSDKREMAFALLWLGMTAYHQNDGQTMQALTQESLMIYQELQDPSGIAIAMFWVSQVATFQGRYSDAEELGMKSLATIQELGDKFWTARVFNALGELFRLQGDYERAGKFYEQDMEILRELRSRVALASPTFNLGWVSLHRGNTRKARALFEESLKLWKEDNNKDGMTHCLAGLAAVLGMLGKPEHAARLFGAAESLLRGLDLPDQKEFDHYLAVVRGQLDEAAFAKAWEEGRAMTREQAIEFARKESK